MESSAMKSESLYYGAESVAFPPAAADHITPSPPPPATGEQRGLGLCMRLYQQASQERRALEEKLRMASQTRDPYNPSGRHGSAPASVNARIYPPSSVPPMPRYLPREWDREQPKRFIATETPHAMVTSAHEATPSALQRRAGPIHRVRFAATETPYAAMTGAHQITRPALRTRATPILRTPVVHRQHGFENPAAVTASSGSAAERTYRPPRLLTPQTRDDLIITQGVASAKSAAYHPMMREHLRIQEPPAITMKDHEAYAVSRSSKRPHSSLYKDTFENVKQFSYQTQSIRTAENGLPRERCHEQPTMCVATETPRPQVDIALDTLATAASKRSLARAPIRFVNRHKRMVQEAKRALKKKSASSAKGKDAQQGSQPESAGLKRKAPSCDGAVLKEVQENAPPPQLPTTTKKQKVNWNKQFARLLQYRTDHGHCNVPKRYPADTALGQWVANQRKYYAAKHRADGGDPTPLSDERERLLTEMGLNWLGQTHVAAVTESKWRGNLEKFRQFRAEHGHVHPPKSDSRYRDLYVWKQSQMRSVRWMAQGKSTSMTEERWNALEEVGVFEVQSEVGTRS